jgi:hypothetical protein
VQADGGAGPVVCGGVLQGVSLRCAGRGARNALLMTMNFKDFIKLLNIRDDVLQGKMNPGEMLKQLPEEQFKRAFWGVADLFKTMKQEADRRGIWKDLITKRDV